MNSYGRDEEKKKKDKNKASVMTRETFGMTFLLFGAVILLICATGSYLFGEIGVSITAFFLGVAGFLTYPLLAVLLYASVVLIAGKGKVSWGWKLRIGFLLLTVFLIVHTATAERFFGNGYGAYLRGCWDAARESGAQGTGGGLILGLIAYPFRWLLSAAGAYVVFSALLVLAIILILLKTPLRKVMKRTFSKKQTESTKGGYDPNEKFDDDEPVSPKRAMAFEDLAPPVHAAMPEAEQRRAVAEPTASAVPPAPPISTPATEKDRSKEILFGTRAQEDYRSNLIFNSDSYFNSRERSSSMYERAPQTRASGESYSSSYFNQASAGEGYVPKRVNEDRPAPNSGYTYSPANDASYSQTPSYRAEPQKAEKEERDYYGHDVPYSEQFSSTPDSEEQTATYIPEPEPRPAPTEPAPDYGRTTPAPAQEPERKIDYHSEDALRSLFSRPVGEDRTQLPREPLSSSDERMSRLERTFRDLEQRGTDRNESRDTFREEKRGLDRNESRDTFREETRGLDRNESRDTFREETRGLDRSESRDTFREETRGLDRSESRDTFREETRGLDRNESRDTFREEKRGLDRNESRDTFREESLGENFGGFSRRDETPSTPPQASPSSAASMFDDDDFSDSGDFRKEDTPIVPPSEPRTRSYAPREKEERLAPPSTEAAPAPKPKRHIYRQYVKPDYSLFQTYSDAPKVSDEEKEHNAAAIEETLAGFKIDAKVVKVTCGSRVTRYDLEIPGNVSVGTVTRKDTDIAMRLHASDGVNVYPNRASGTISVDVPNETSGTVGLLSLLYAPEYVNSKPGSLMFAIGKDVAGNPVIGNITKMKQILVAGTTGSGKSVTLHTMLISLICKYSPEELRLILIDPKGEFTIYEGLPHLMINEIISDAQKAITALNWAIKEMERRYTLFQNKTRSGTLARNIEEYNANLTPDEEKLCKIVIIVDELADLMSVAKKDIEERVQRLTQKARAAGIHLVLSTQRPSVDVITGVIKGNLPTRMALRVIQEVDSRTIIDETGAQKLLGNGDMLFRTEGMFNCMRVQGAFLSDKEVERVVASVKANNEAYFDTEVADYINNSGQAAGAASEGEDEGGEEVNEQYLKALKIVVKLGQASISLIQRKCAVGYNHAGRILEWMESMGYISPFNGKAKARTVILTPQEYESKYGSLD